MPDRDMAVVVDSHGEWEVVFDEHIDGRECAVCGEVFVRCEGLLMFPATRTSPEEWDCEEGFPLLHDPDCPAVRGFFFANCCAAKQEALQEQYDEDRAMERYYDLKYRSEPQPF